MPGTIAKLEVILEIDSPKHAIPLSELLAAAVKKAKNGIAVTKNQSDTLAAKKHELEPVSGFKEFYLDKGQVPQLAQNFSI